MSGERKRGIRAVAGVSATVAFLVAPPSAGADIGRANLDGSDADRSFIATPCPDFKAFDCRGVAVDGEHIYWSSDYDEGLDEAGAIGRANLDGSGVVQRFIATPDPEGLAVDGEHIYWGNFGSQSIGRANLDGSAVSPSFINSRYAGSVAVDAEHIYWIDVGMEKFPATLGRANLDGSDVNCCLIDDAVGSGVAVDSEHIYWGSESAIGRANLDASGVETGFITTPASPSGVAVDGEHVYWSNFPTGTIGRANLDGSGMDPNFITGAGCVAGVAVDAGHIYWADEGACSDDAVTIKIKGKRRTLKGRNTAVKLRVPADEASPPVRGTLKLKTRKRVRYRGEERRVTLADDSLRVTSGRTKAIRLRLSKSKAKLIRNKEKARKMRAIARVEDRAGNEGRVAKKMALTPRG